MSSEPLGGAFQGVKMALGCTIGSLKAAPQALSMLLTSCYSIRKKIVTVGEVGIVERRLTGPVTGYARM
jgi:hypothetical protein